MISDFYPMKVNSEVDSPAAQLVRAILTDSLQELDGTIPWAFTAIVGRSLGMPETIQACHKVMVNLDKEISFGMSIQMR